MKKESLKHASHEQRHVEVFLQVHPDQSQQHLPGFQDLETSSSCGNSCETGDLFDFSSIQFIATRPIASNNCLRLFGKRTDPTPQGFVGYGAGHTETALNSPRNPAPYYAAGIDFSPENLVNPLGATRAATLLNNITGFSNFATFLTNNSINVDRIGFSFGPKNGDFTKSWNCTSSLSSRVSFNHPVGTIPTRLLNRLRNRVKAFCS